MGTNISNYFKFLIIQAILLIITYASFAEEVPIDTNLSGGTTTREDVTINAFSKPAKNLPLKYRRLFTQGNNLFRANWTSSKNHKFFGLGPTYTNSSCISCHLNDGRSTPPDFGKNGTEGLTIFINNADRDEVNYGTKIDTKSIEGVPSEAKINITYEKVFGNFDDGTPYTLIKPELNIEQASFGEIKNKIHGRVATSIIGIGLIETIPDKLILKWADPYDQDNDGISGRVNIVYDPVTEKKSIGKFGWKASKSSVKHQVISALYEDIGITSNIFPVNRCPKIQMSCLRQSKNIEADKSIIDALTFYTSVIAVPARRDFRNINVVNGKKIFIKIGCANCHLTNIKTGIQKNEQLKFLNNQNIQPYTDLLLHDMGDGLAENTNEGLADRNEWRTAPLWGLGLIKNVNGKVRLLHDGRARSIEEAILWHEGEAKKSRENYLKLDKYKRDLLLKFLNSL